MYIIFGILCVFVGLPVLGEILLFFLGRNISAGQVTAGLVIANFTYAVIVILCFAWFSRKRVSLYKLPPLGGDLGIMRRLFILMVVVCGFVFLISGYKFLFMSAYRGDLRVSMGWYGPFYAWMIRFLAPVSLLLATLVYLLSARKTKLKFYYITTWLLVIFTAIFTGYKSVIVMSLLPALSLIFYHRSLIRIGLTLLPIIILMLIFSTSMVRGISFFDAYQFLIYRLTSMTAYGAIGVWEHFKDGEEFKEVIKLSYGVFGNNIAESLLGHSRNTVEFLSTNLSRLMTYLVYPDKEGALTGTVNVTVTNFGEAVYMFGRFFWLHAIFAGVVAGLVIKRFKVNLNQGKLINGCMWLLYFFTILLPWFNSGNVFILVSLPTIVWLLMTWVTLIVVVRGVRFI